MRSRPANHRVLIFGSGGMLGTRLTEYFTQSGHTVLACDRVACDITNERDVETMIASFTPTVVLNAAAWTDVDGAEDSEEQAHRLNGDAAGILARVCRDANCLLVHYSTDYVFGGSDDDQRPDPKTRRPISVDTPIDPVNAYGRTKAAGEEAIRASGADHLILRTAWLVDSRAKNFLTTIAGLACDRDVLQVVDDQFGRPTSAVTLASMTAGLIDAGARGTHHACNGGIATWHDLAARVVNTLGLSCRIEACGSEKYPRPARRPGWSVLDLSATEAILKSPIDDWTVAVDRAINEWRLHDGAKRLPITRTGVVR